MGCQLKEATKKPKLVELRFIYGLYGSLAGFSGEPFAVTFFPVTIGILLWGNPLTIDGAFSLFRRAGSTGFATHTSESGTHDDEGSDYRFFHVHPPKRNKK